MKIAGVGPGTEVITTPLTWAAGNQPILMLGAIQFGQMFLVKLV